MQRPIPPNPYQGLFAFRETDSHFFFGREEVVKVLKERVEKTSLQAIVGASGSGKSSVVFAGLVPEFRKQDWLIQDFRPGRNPYRNLARAILKLQGKESPTTKEISDLGRSLEKGETKLLDALDDTLEQNPNATLLLIADQFEELFTISEANLSEVATHTEATQDKGSSEETAKAFDPKPFIDQLLASTRQDGSRFHLLLTLRADFMGRASSHRAFADALNHESTLYTLGPMNSQELQAAIEKPAEKQGVSLEEGLSERILKEVDRQEGSLPLLEFALSELWKKQDNGILTHQAYDGIGGVEGALARHADATYNSLKPAERTLAQRVFLQLVYPGAGQEDTRRVASYQELKDVWQVVNTLANKRLLVTDESEGQQTAEVIHEALIRRWGKLREWMNDHRAFRTWQERLRQDVKLWQGKDKAHDTLLSGYRLDEALKMQKDYDSLLSEDERSFIAEGLQQREHEVANREAMQQREKDALTKRNEEIQKRLETERALALEAQARQKAEEERLKQQLNDAAKLTEEQQKRLEAERALAQEVKERQNAEKVRFKQKLEDQQSRYVEKLQGRRRTIIALYMVIISMSLGGLATLYGFNGQRVAQREAARALHATQIALARNLVTQGQMEYEENPLLGLQLTLEGLLTVPEGEETRLKELTEPVSGLALQGRLLKLGDDVEDIFMSEAEKRDWFVADHAAKADEVRRFSDGETLATLSGEVYEITSSPNSQWFMVHYEWEDTSGVQDSSREPPFVPFELRSIEDIETPIPLSGRVETITFSPDSQLFLVDYYDAPDELRNVANVRTPELLPDEVTDITFSPNSQWFVVRYSDSPTEVRNVEDVDIPTLLPGKVKGINFSPDSQWFLVYYYDATELRNVSDIKKPEQLPSDLKDFSFDFSPNSQWLIGHHSYRIVLLSIANVKEPIKFSGEVRAITFSPDSQWFVVEYNNSPTELRNVSDVETFISLPGVLYNVFFSPNSQHSQWLVVVYTDGSAELRNADHFEESTPMSLSGVPIQVFFSADAQWFGVFYDDSVELYKTAEPKTPILHAGEVFDAGFIFDSPWFAVVYNDYSFEVRRTAEPETSFLIMPASEVESAYQTVTPDHQWFVVINANGSSELWSLWSETPFATELGLNLSDNSFNFGKENQRLVLVYRDGRSYLLDLSWIQAMGGRDNLSREELIKLACDGPLKLGIVTAEDLKPFLGENESKVCK